MHVPATTVIGVPRPGAARRNVPTPGSTGLPARTILVAKRLTNRSARQGGAAAQKYQSCHERVLLGCPGVVASTGTTSWPEDGRL